MLFPVLGFFNVYPFRYSFVADHFQYLACIGPIVLAAVGMRTGLNALKGPLPKPVVSGIFLTALGVLTWRQCGMYADAETLYRTIIKKNPACWMAHLNLGYALRGAGRINEAIEQYREVLKINPNLVEVCYNLGNAAWQAGQKDEAIANYRRALQINPNYADVHYNLGNALYQTGQTGEAIAHYRKAMELKPGDIAILNNCAVALQETGRPAEAVQVLEQTLTAARAMGREPLAAEISAEIERLTREQK
jgi:tetratricopeptide (TPR) repeat protein